jgi:hypothetical protein
MSDFLIGLLGGIAFLVAGLFVTRLHWRTDIPPFDRHTNALKVFARPSRHASGSLPLIRALNAIGAALLVYAAVHLARALALATGSAR